MEHISETTDWPEPARLIVSERAQKIFDEFKELPAVRSAVVYNMARQAGATALLNANVGPTIVLDTPPRGRRDIAALPQTVGHTILIRPAEMWPSTIADDLYRQLLTQPDLNPQYPTHRNRLMGWGADAIPKGLILAGLGAIAERTDIASDAFANGFAASGLVLTAVGSATVLGSYHTTRWRQTSYELAHPWTTRHQAPIIFTDKNGGSS